VSQATARPGRRTQAERRAATEQRVLDAAVALTAERGVRAVTLATVGEKAGYSRGIVTHHFGSRRALLDALVGRLQDTFRPPTASAGTGLDRLLALVDAYLVHLDAEPEIARAFLVLWVESLAAEPELRPVFADRDKRFRSAIADAVRAGTADGSITADAGAEALALAIVGLLRGVGMQMLHGPVGPDVGEIRQQVRRLLGKGLR
jgi:AcrR family transcriptional regulator